MDSWFRDEPSSGAASPEDAPTQVSGLSAVRPSIDSYAAPTQFPQQQAREPQVPQRARETQFPEPGQFPQAPEPGQLQPPQFPPLAHERPSFQGGGWPGDDEERLGDERERPGAQGERLRGQGPVSTYPEYEPHPHDRRGPGRPNRKPIIAGAAVAGVLVLGLIAYLAVGNGSPKTSNTASAGGGISASPSPTHTSFQPTSVDPATAAEQTATAFLNAWQSGDLQAAAKYTDNPTEALAALNDYKSGLNLSALTLKPQAAVVAAASPSASAGAAATGVVASGDAGAVSGSGAVSGPGADSGASSGASAASGAGAGTAANPSGTVPFTATATVQLATQSASGQSVGGQNAPAAQNAPMTWSYSSSLVAFKQSDGWSVRWNSSILAPNMADGQKLSVVAVPPGVGKVVDGSGTKLSTYSETAMQNIATALAKKAPTGSGTPGAAVQVVDASGKAVGSPVATLVKPVDTAELKTTIDPTVESLARHAVAKFPRSAMVVLRPSTGAILAVANSSGSGDMALAGGLAPGSTFKIVTSAALLNHGYVSLYTPVACPLTVTVQGVVYHNSTDATGKKEESLPASTPFLTDFAESCNNAFTPFYKQLEGGKLASTASTYFALNQPWDIGLGSNTYFSMPTDSSGAELAQEDFGQGQIVASPLAMASVAATVGTGSFHQPYLVDGVTKVQATPLPSGTAANLKTLMHAVVTGGTAAGVFSGAPGTVYAKTGTAEADANKDGKPNAWMVAYDRSADVAIGVVVQDSGFGADFAGPEAAYVLSHL